MARYRVMGQPHYRGKRLYRPGEPVDIPDGEKPAPEWIPLNDDGSAKALPKPQPPSGKTKT